LDFETARWIAVAGQPTKAIIGDAQLLPRGFVRLVNKPSTV
jgi:hypothetical protein